MDKSTESASDSDSNSSTSWVFVDDTVESRQQNLNMFHLDCSREPIQELTEQDLLSASSDLESDTDGVSVISESELPVEESLNVECILGLDSSEGKHTSDDNVDTIIEEPFDLLKDNDANELSRIINPFYMLGVGVVLTAVLVAFYNQGTIKSNENDSNDSRNVEQVEIKNAVERKSCNTGNTGFDKELEHIIDIAMSCALIHNNNDLVEKEIRKCVKKGYKSKILPTENNIGNKDNRGKMNNKKEDKNYLISKKKINNNMMDNTEQQYMVNLIKTTDNKQKPFKVKNRHDKKLKNNGKNKVFQNSDTNHKNKKTVFKLHKSMNDNKVKIHGKVYSPKNKNSKLKNGTGSHQKSEKSKERVSNKKTRVTIVGGPPRNGEWYSRLYNARDNIRKQEQVSDWVFDRAHIRSKKRNKAQWYFKWMNTREQMRHKHNYRPYSS